MLHTPKLKARARHCTIAEMQDRRDLLPSLQLLEGRRTSLSRPRPSQLGDHHYSEDGRSADVKRHAWLPSSAEQFYAYFVDRRKVQAARIASILGSPTVASGEPHQHAAAETKSAPVIAD
jgi:hypothetical protein